MRRCGRRNGGERRQGAAAASDLLHLAINLAHLIFLRDCSDETPSPLSHYGYRRAQA
jgi:hypothetical protein